MSMTLSAPVNGASASQTDEFLRRARMATAAKLTAAPEPATVQPGHFAWCGPNACVTTTFRSGEIITEHFSAPVRLAVPEGEDIGADYVLSSQIYIDDQYEGPHIWIALGGEDCDELSLDGPTADAFCDAMQTFIDGIRTQRRQLDAKQAGK